MRTRFNSDGRPAKDGRFELINGRLTLCDRPLEDGQHVGFDVAFMDSHSGSRTFQDSKSNSFLSDAERDYAVAAAKAKHDLMHPNRPFTADQASAAIERAAAANKSQAQLQDSAAEIERLQSEAHGARIARKHVLANAWRR